MASKTPSTQEPQKQPQQNDNELIIRKSNNLIDAKYRANVLENKVMAISLSMLKKDPVTGELYAEIPAKRIESLICSVNGKHRNDPNIYNKLLDLSHSFTGHAITLEGLDDFGKMGFHTFNIVSDFIYQNGMVKIIYNRNLTGHLSELQGSYTTMQLATLLSFDKIASFRLYELLKKDAFRIKDAKDGTIDRTYEINELRAILGLINTDAPHIQQAVKEGKTWEYIVKNVCKSGDIKYVAFSELRRNVLEPAIEELSAKSDVSFTYDVKGAGRGGKVKWVIFHIQHNALHETVKEELTAKMDYIEETNPEYAKLSKQRENEERGIYYEEVKEFLLTHGMSSEGFTFEYFESLYQDSGQSIAVIKEEILYSISVPEIRNYLGWLRKAVKERYSRNAMRVVEGSAMDREKAAVLEQRPAYNEDKLLGMWMKYRMKEWIPAFLRACGCIRVEDFEEAVESNDLRLKAAIDFKRPEDQDKPSLHAAMLLVWENVKKNPSFESFIGSFEYPDAEIVEDLYPLEERLERYYVFCSSM